MTNDVIADMLVFGDLEVVQTTANLHSAYLDSFPALKKEADHIKACRVMDLTTYPSPLAYAFHYGQGGRNNRNDPSIRPRKDAYS